jgi:hypothetical protein
MIILGLLQVQEFLANAKGYYTQYAKTAIIPP